MTLSNLSWIVGTVNSVLETSGDFAIVDMGRRSFAVVNVVRQEFLACCPTLRHAREFALKGDAVLKLSGGMVDCTPKGPLMFNPRV